MPSSMVISPCLPKRIDDGEAVCNGGQKHGQNCQGGNALFDSFMDVGVVNGIGQDESKDCRKNAAERRYDNAVGQRFSKPGLCKNFSIKICGHSLAAAEGLDGNHQHGKQKKYHKK